jgi:hypothetical protein
VALFDPDFGGVGHGHQRPGGSLAGNDSSDTSSTASNGSLVGTGFVNDYGESSIPSAEYGSSIMVD